MTTRPSSAVFDWPVRVYWEDTDAGGMFVVSQATLRYLSPARLDDELIVTSQLSEVGRAGLRLSQTTSKIHYPGPNQLLCQGTIRVGWIAEANFKPARIPPTVLEALK